IYSQRLDANGQDIGLIQQISSLAGANPAVAYNTADNEFLVVWENGTLTAEIGYDIVGHRVGTNGSEVGDDLRISTMALPGDGRFQATTPAVVFNGDAHEYLVVWRGDRDAGSLVDDEFEVFGQRLDARPDSFGEVGNDFRISDMGNALRPALA